MHFPQHREGAVSKQDVMHAVQAAFPSALINLLKAYGNLINTKTAAWRCTVLSKCI